MVIESAPQQPAVPGAIPRAVEPSAGSASGRGHVVLAASEGQDRSGTVREASELLRDERSTVLAGRHPHDVTTRRSPAALPAPAQRCPDPPANGTAAAERRTRGGGRRTASRS